MDSKQKMIVPYEWILEKVGEEPTTIASKMILFRGERVFRVGLINTANSPVLFFMAIDLVKIGMHVEDVKYGIQDSGIGPATMTEMEKEYIGNGISLQLFTSTLDKKVTGNCTFVFRICIDGTDPSYSYQLADRLAKDQLWAALKNQQELVDVEFVVQDKTFPAHKSILAARSQVFSAEFVDERPAKDGRHIRIDNVEPSTVENFLHFIYTGEPKGTLADEELLKLAEKYQLKTLTRLCKIALRKIDCMQMVELQKCLYSHAEELPSSKIMPEKETEIFFDRTTPSFRCNSTLSIDKRTKCVMKYQNENIFFVYYLTSVERVPNSDDFDASGTLHIICAKHRSFGLKVENIYCNLHSYIEPCKRWSKIESKNVQKDAELLNFAANFKLKASNTFDYAQYYIDVKIISTIGNYYYEMMDNAWLADFWYAANMQILTDVEIFVGTVKVMEAHRVILSARSPVLNATLSKISNNTKKSIVTFGPEFDVEIVNDFLNFLYTGSLKTSPRGQQLSKLAAMYEVETLKNVCQLIDVNPPDVEELTNGLLSL